MAATGVRNYVQVGGTFGGKHHKNSNKRTILYTVAKRIMFLCENYFCGVRWYTSQHIMLQKHVLFAILFYAVSEIFYVE